MNSLPTIQGQTTIAAIATAKGVGAISVIRISGPNSLAVLRQVFPLSKTGSQGLSQNPDTNKNKPWPPRLMRFGNIYHPHDGRLLDQGLAVWFQAPHSATGEDSAEIHAHGGVAVTALVLEAVLAAGAKLAEPGEFTLRAFQNGRLDLTQAEAVADLVAARSTAEATLAARHLSGGLSERVESIHKAVLTTLVELEAAIDFGDELGDMDPEALRQVLDENARKPLTELLLAGQQGRVYKEGLSLALGGPPNVGKSSLFNALIGQDRAMVSPTPGTTRDYITTETTFGELRVELVDTAGLSYEPQDELDAMGQQRSQNCLAHADLLLWVRDASLGHGSDSPPDFLPPEKTLIVWNKVDFSPPPPENSTDLAVSAHTGEGLDHLKTAILQAITGLENPSPPDIIPNLRHQQALAQALEGVTTAWEDLTAGQPPDICATGLQSALSALGLIRGHTTPEDLLKEIFSRFCLGK